jgi:hypothetical protein
VNEKTNGRTDGKQISKVGLIRRKKCVETIKIVVLARQRLAHSWFGGSVEFESFSGVV